MQKQILLPCGLCGGDGYSPFSILNTCPECDGQGSISSFIEVDEEGNEIELESSIISVGREPEG